jgi:hypothetical protein
MSVSETSICNSALYKLGAARIANLSEDSDNARYCDDNYEMVRDQVLRGSRWKFALTRTTLAPSATAPEFYYENAFLLPADCLRPIFPPRLDLDWKVENHLGSPAILTNDGDTLEVRYIAKVTDTTIFDPLFVEALACKLAWQLCEKITQSTSKKESLMQEYTFAIREAKRINAIEIGHFIQPIDEWVSGRLSGQLVNTEWRQE